MFIYLFWYLYTSLTNTENWMMMTMTTSVMYNVKYNKNELGKPFVNKLSLNAFLLKYVSGFLKEINSLVLWLWLS